ncbi:unnamed protein product, partial [Mesorhabditis belari]|uniref:Cytidyltransferase-like domain-containing protein n=1 Tax=Mesorhabditis belari TaxID=2138241 RepID=A0AAF3EMJ1_9BILA
MISSSSSRSSNAHKAVLICCGIFDPPTYAHLRMFERARDFLQRCLDWRVIEGVISPCGDQPRFAELTPLKHRLRMIEAAIRRSSWIRLSDWEAAQSKQPTCMELLRHFKKEYSSKFGETVEPILLCGGDVIDALIEVKRSSELLWSQNEMDSLLGEFTVVVIARPHTNPARTAYLLDAIRKHERNFHLIEDETYPNDASSTRLRLALRRGESIKYCTSDDVVEYINEQNLYTQPFNHRPGCAFYQVAQASSEHTVSTDKSQTTSTILMSETQIPSSAESTQSESDREKRKSSQTRNVISEPMRPKMPEELTEHLPQCPLSKKSPKLPIRDYPKENSIQVEHHPKCTESKEPKKVVKKTPPTPPMRRSSTTKMTKTKEIKFDQKVSRQADQIEDIWEPSTSEDTTRTENLEGGVDISEPLPSPPSLKTNGHHESKNFSVPEVPKIPRVSLPSHITDWRFGYESPNYDNVTLDELLEASTSWAEYMSAECKRLNAERETSVQSVAHSEPQPLRTIENGRNIPKNRGVRSQGDLHTKPPPPLKEPPDKKKVWPFNRNAKSLKDKEREERNQDEPSNEQINGGVSVPNLLKAAHNVRSSHSVEQKKSIRFASGMAKSAENLANERAEVDEREEMSKSMHVTRRSRLDDGMSKSYHGNNRRSTGEDEGNEGEDDDGKITLSFRRYRLAATPETTV